MAEGLSLNRIGNVSKSQTALNVSQDFKERLKQILEEEIIAATREMERKVKAEAPDAKTLLNLGTPQLSLHRVKSLMEHNTDLTVGSEAAITVKALCERRIMELTRQAELRAKEERLSTIKARHIPESAARPPGDGEDAPGEAGDAPLIDGGGAMGGFLYHDRLKTLCQQYLTMKIDPEALEEIGFWMEDSAEQEMLNIEKSFKEVDARAILASYNKINGLLSQLTIKKVLNNAEELARERNKRSVTLEEISDAFNRTYLR